MQAFLLITFGKLFKLDKYLKRQYSIDKNNYIMEKFYCLK